MPDDPNQTVSAPPPAGEAAEPSAGFQQTGGQPSAPSWSGAGQAATADFRSSLSSRGIDASRFASDDEAVAYYTRLSPDYVARLHQMSQLAERMYPYYRQAMLAQQEQQEVAAPPAPPAPTASPEAPEPYWPVAPEWKGEWADRLAIGPDGQVTLKDPMSNPALIDKYQAYRQWQKQSLESLLSDPRKAIKLDEYFEEKAGAIQEQVQQLIQQHYQQVQQQQQATGYVTQNAPWLFQMDPQTGQPAIDPLTGRYVPTDGGRSFHTLLSRLSNNPSESDLADIALLAMHGMAAVQAQQAGGNGRQLAREPAPQQVPFGQQRFLGAGYNPSRGGTVYPSPVSAPQSNPLGKQDVEMGLANAFRQAGLMR